MSDSKFEEGRVEGIKNALLAFELHVEDYPNWDCGGDCEYGRILKMFAKKVEGDLGSKNDY